MFINVHFNSCERVQFIYNIANLFLTVIRRKIKLGLSQKVRLLLTERLMNYFYVECETKSVEIKSRLQSVDEFSS